MTTAEAFYYSCGILVGSIIGFIIGKMHERWEWNQLIRSGKIPRPQQGGRAWHKE